ncbi:MAG: AAA family ATPase, partial [Pikeienuella sp.]
MGDRHFTDIGRDFTVRIAEQGKNGTTINKPLVEAILAEIECRQIDVVIVDPFVSSHGGPENDNTAIDAVVKEWGRIADRGDCAVELVHHVRKGAAGAKTEIEVEDFRGAVALLAGVRSARVLNGMTADEAEKADVQNRFSHFRVSDGKANMAPRSNKAEWYHLVGVSLGNHGPLEPADEVGVVTAWKWPDVFEGRTAADLLAVQRGVDAGDWRESAQAKAWVGYAVAEALSLDVENKLHRGKIRGMLKAWIKRGALKIEQRKDENRKDKAFVVV